MTSLPSINNDDEVAFIFERCKDLCSREDIQTVLDEYYNNLPAVGSHNPVLQDFNLIASKTQLPVSTIESIWDHQLGFLISMGIAYC